MSDSTQTTPMRPWPFRLTPWVGRIMVVNAVAAVFLLTVFTAPGVTEVLRFDTESALRRPWTFLSYLVVHAGPLQLGLNLLLFWVVGPAVEQRLPGRTFLLFYLCCGVGAALFAAGLASLLDAPPMIGASGAVLGVALAAAMLWPDADVTFAGGRFTIALRVLVFSVVTVDVVLALARPAGVAHLGYLGGLAAAYLFLRLRTLTRHTPRRPAAPPPRRAVLAPIGVGQARPVEVRPAAARPESAEPISPEELDRVLDKISAYGLESLTVEERRFLDEAAERKRREVQ